MDAALRAGFEQLGMLIARPVPAFHHEGRTRGLWGQLARHRLEPDRAALTYLGRALSPAGTSQRTHIRLFAAPLANSAPRGGAAYGVGVSLGITIVYLMLFKVAGAAGSSGALHPTVAAWIPNVLFAIAGAFMIRRVRT